jgi:hypothetical protein
MFGRAIGETHRFRRARGANDEESSTFGDPAARA